MDHAEAQAIIDARPMTSTGKDITCPECKEGKYRWTFYASCDNPKCRLYNSFAMGRCGICHAPRYHCCC